MKRRKNKNKQLLRLAGEYQPWDFGYMLRIEKQMLKQMQEYHKQAHIIEDSPIIVRQIKWALKLLNIADGTESAWHCSSDGLYIKNNGIVGRNPNYKSWITANVNIRNWKRFWKIPNNQKPDLTNPLTQDYLRQLKAWYIYNKLRMYYLQTWWD